jgi:crotonobetainyl-CoA:carnitine CoA-transferase CaiB-like acyl-CoA transferase
VPEKASDITMSALSGIRIVEFEGWTAGALLGMLLADQGAEVIRIARADKPVDDRPGFDMLARGKRSISLDLQKAEDKDIALRLASTADIVIENLRPGALDALGLGRDILRASNPRLIHIRLPGFASDDIAHKGIAAYEGIIAATIGLFTEINLLKPLFGMDPVYSPLALPSIYGAVLGAVACNAALYARETTGEGATLEVPLAAAGAMAMSSIFMHVQGAPAHYETPRLPKLVKSVVLPALRRYLRNSPTRQQKLYAKMQTAIPAMMSAYPCADGRLLYIFAIDNPGLSVRLLETLGLIKDAIKFGFITSNPYLGPTNAPNFATTSTLPAKAQAWLRDQISQVLLTSSADQWETLLSEAGLPCAVVRTTNEWLMWKPLHESQAIVETDGRSGPGLQCWFPGTAPKVIGTIPSRDEHGTALRREATAITIGDPVAGKISLLPWRPLAGLRVLDFCSMVAGPLAGRTLAELGATVIKVESPGPHHGPRMTCWYGLDVNQGKDSILIDLKSAGGKEVAAKLISAADVVLHNFTPPAAARIGLDDATLKKINPKVLICEIAAFAGPLPSSLDGRHGYDPVLQMASGISARYGSPEQPELHGIASCVDCLTGYSAAFGIVAALSANKRGNTIGSVKTSLVQAANLIQFPFTAGAPDGAPSGQSARGSDSRSRLWRTRDGWVYTALKGVQQEVAFDRIMGTNGFTKVTTAAAMSRLLDANIAAVKIGRLTEIRQSFDEAKHSIRAVHRTMGQLKITQLAPDYIRVDGIALPSISEAQKPGTSTKIVLQDNGFDTDAIAALVQTGAVATQLSAEFLP